MSNRKAASVDIAARLLALDVNDRHASATLQEAADEIDQLRAALRRVRDEIAAQSSLRNEYQDWSDALQVIGDALGEPSEK